MGTLGASHISRPAILVVDDDPIVPAIVAKALAPLGAETALTTDSGEAMGLLAARPFDLVITDVRLGDATSGLDLLRAARRRPSTQVILISAHGSLDCAVEGLRAGAFDFIAKPFDPRQVAAAAERALALAAQAAPRRPSAPATPLPAELLGRSAAMIGVYKQIARAAEAQSPVLLTGESGTGKELVARAVHDYGGGDRPRPFVAVNCGALAETLLESELFGHVRGSFTGAVSDRRGLFEQAAGGTLFLDEIGETSAALQVKLLRVLQEGEVRPVGGVRDVKVNVRVVAATNRDLETEVAEKRFREDLYYRLGAITIRVPPLRERREDIALLAARFARNAAGRARRDVALSDEAIEALAAHSWPGNVRELENTVERLVIAVRGDRVSAEDVAEALRQASRGPRGPAAFDDLPTLDTLEKRYVLHVVEAVGGNRTQAARVLGIDRRTLYRMAARWGVPLGAEEGETEPDVPARLEPQEVPA